MAQALKMIGDLALETADRGYPLIVHIPHSLISVATYRQWREKEGVAPEWLYDMCVSMFTHSQGGGIGIKTVLMGQFPLSYLASRWDFVWVQVLSYLANYWSPFDVVNRILVQPKNPLRLFCVTMDATDAFGSMCGLIDYARKTFPENKLLPAMVGVILFSTGQFIRSLDSRSRGLPGKSFLATPSFPGVPLGIVFSSLYQYFGYEYQQGKHRDKALKSLTLLFVTYKLLDDALGFDAFARIHEPVVAFLQVLRRVLKLGPQNKIAVKNA
jgi:hypothetical protein